MNRFYLPPEEWPDVAPNESPNERAATLRGGEAHHARDVLRLETGDALTIFDGVGREARAVVHALAPGAVELRLGEITRAAPRTCRITLAQAIPKGKNMELIVQKAVELGAAAIIPLLSARTVVQLDRTGAARKENKWQQIAIEAAKQCGQNWLPRVATPRTPNEFFSGLSPDAFDLRLIGSLQPGARPLREILGEWRRGREKQEQDQQQEKDQEKGKRRRPGSVLLLIGPEGDFTAEEHGLALAHGCAPLTLGPIVLRVETAALCCLSILAYELC